MPEPTVTPLRTRAAVGYTDTAALNDIHTILTADPGEEALADIAQVLTRAGRPLVAVRGIEITTTETALGWPVAHARAGDTSVVIRQVHCTCRHLTPAARHSQRDAPARQHERVLSSAPENSSAVDSTGRRPRHDSCIAWSRPQLMGRVTSTKNHAPAAADPDVP